jgi:hypothetical protein
MHTLYELGDEGIYARSPGIFTFIVANCYEMRQPTKQE